jgi:hypothetical protein
MAIFRNVYGRDLLCQRTNSQDYLEYIRVRLQSLYLGAADDGETGPAKSLASSRAVIPSTQARGFDAVFGLI